MGRALDPSNSLFGGASPAAEPAHDATVVLAAAVDQTMESTLVMQTPPIQQAPARVIEEAPSAMDFDLDLGAADTASPVTASAAAPTASASDIDFDLDLGGGETKVDDVTARAVDINFDEPAAAGNSIDFNFDLGDTPAVTDVPLDLSAINLDLGESSAPASGGTDISVVATKLELAQAYEEMGDREGARELLQEVLTEGSPEQQETARTKLAQLG